MCTNHSMNAVELRIAVPWGYIAGKTWGESINKPIILLHGRETNCALFDDLINELPEHFYYIGVDLPGHGKSSPFPLHSTQTALDYHLALTEIVQYYKYERYTLLGHDFGGELALLYAHLHPELIAGVIMLDAVLCATISTKHFAKYVKLQKSVIMNDKLFTYEQALDAILVANKKMSMRLGKALLARQLREQSNGFFHLKRYSIDYRLPFDERYLVDVMRKNPPSCPILMLLSSNAKQALNAYQRQCANIEVIHLEGDFMTMPQLRTNPIGKFLLSSTSSSRL